MENLKQKVFSGFIWKFCERFLSQIIAFIVSLVVARILDPEDYGIVAIVTVFINLGNVFFVSGFASALIQKEEADDLDFSTILYCSLLLSVVIYFILFFAAPFIAKFYKVELLCKVIRVYGLVIPISSFGSIQNAYVARNMQFKKTFLGTFLGTVISGALGIFFALKGFGVWALVFQALLNISINTIILFIIIDWRPKLKFSYTRAVPMIKFGLDVFSADFIGTLFNQLNNVLIGKKYSVDQLAFYNRGQSFPYLLSGNMGNILSNVMYPAFSSESKDEEKLVEMSRKSVRFSTYILSPLYLGLAAAGYHMIKLLLTDKWISSYPFLLIICFSCLFSAVSTLDLQVLKARGRSDLVFKTEFIKKPIWLAATVAALFINVYALAVVLIFVGFVELLVNAIAVQKVLPYKVSTKLWDFFVSVIPGLIMFAVVFAMNLLKLKSIIVFPLQIVVGVGFYVLYSVITKNENFYYLLDLLKKKRGNND